MYFHRANQIKPAQHICLEGIRKTSEILECTICNPQIHLTTTRNLLKMKDKQSQQITLLHRPPIRKQLPSVELPLTVYTEQEANRLLIEIAKDRQLLMNLSADQQTSAGGISNLYFRLSITQNDD